MEKVAEPADESGGCWIGVVGPEDAAQVGGVIEGAAKPFESIGGQFDASSMMALWPTAI